MEIHNKILILVVLLSSCARQNFYLSRINDIPTSFPNFNTEIRFSGEPLPQNPYFEIIDIDLREKGIKNKKDIRQRLELMAIKEGVDAIIEVEAWTESIQEGNWITVLLDILDDDTDPTTFTVNYTRLTGRGIMYLENLDFIKFRPEFEYFYLIDSETGFPSPLFKAEYKLTGQEYMIYAESDGALDLYTDYLQFYSDFHLLEQREGWSYKMDDNLLKKRILWDPNGFRMKTCIPNYDEQNRMTLLKIIHHKGKIDGNEFIRYSYNDHGKIEKRIVEIHDGTIIYEDFIYENEQLKGKEFLINKGDEQILLRSSMHYYSPNYLHDYYFHEVTKQQENRQ